MRQWQENHCPSLTAAKPHGAAFISANMYVLLCPTPHTEQMADLLTLYLLLLKRKILGCTFWHFGRGHRNSVRGDCERGCLIFGDRKRTPCLTSPTSLRTHTGRQTDATTISQAAMPIMPACLAEKERQVYLPCAPRLGLLVLLSCTHTHALPPPPSLRNILPPSSLLGKEESSGTVGVEEGRGKAGGRKMKRHYLKQLLPCIYICQ